ncbi:MAG: class I SAM-dependent methyltransferase [Clostridia bacterium]|nr:class I SAM-dependent methyltransferase [Clostridia bacterium]
MKFERMADFFADRIEMYDEHMLTEVEGCKEGYKKMASLIPDDTEALLDLGCGTGLELDEIFLLYPDLKVTGIDLSDVMLGRLRDKHPDKNLSLVCADYFEENLGENKFDCAVSFQTMHHFPKEKKLSLYKKINASLKEKGIYIECDYMVLKQEEENFWFSENERLRKENGITDNGYYHYDTPCTVDNQTALLKKAGFYKVTQVFRMENTTMLIAEK